MSDPSSQPAVDPVGAAIGKLAGLFGRERDEGGLSPGDRAELRRMDAAFKPLPPALWRLLARDDVAAAMRTFARHDLADVERAFAVAIQAAAETGGGGTLPVGTALARTGYAEARFVRLVRARDLEQVALEAGLVARWCAAKGVRPRFADRFRQDGFGPFVIAAALDSADADRRSHAIARDYFANEGRSDSSPTEPTP